MQRSEVVYRSMDSPVGRLLLAATDAGLLRVAFEHEDFDRIVESLREQFDVVDDEPAACQEAVSQLNEYFAGSRRAFELRLDLRTASGFTRGVQTALPRIPYGETMTYGELAAGLGHPGAARAVGSACRTNPLPIVLPSHRVVRTDGVAGGTPTGDTIKKQLLGLEVSHLRSVLPA